MRLRRTRRPSGATLDELHEAIVTALERAGVVLADQGAELRELRIRITQLEQRISEHEQLSPSMHGEPF